jgi:excisionase family DNA binding protein
MSLIIYSYMSTDMREREWLAAKEVANALGVHVTAVYRAFHEGRLPVVRLSEGGAIRIHRSALNPNESSGIRVEGR